MDSNSIISIISLVIAGFAIFAGPVLSHITAKRSMLSSMRQDWINTLRELLAKISSYSLFYYVASYEDRSDEEYKELTYLQYQILLMLNSNELDHQKLAEDVKNIIDALGTKNYSKFEDSHIMLLSDGRNVLKKEWSTVKKL